MQQPDAHSRICSPFANKTWEDECAYKQQYAATLLLDAGLGVTQCDEIPIIGDPARQYGYRNKMEFSFTQLDNGAMSLAFFERGTKKRVPIHGCALAEPVINEAAQHILDWINTVQIPLRSLKSLIVRSNSAQQVIAALFIKDELAFAQYPELTDKLLGFTLYYSTHKSPASVPTKQLYRDGADSLAANILGTHLMFGLLSFFQIAIPMFTRAVQKIAEWVPARSAIVDYYAGVGAISLPLASQYEDAVLVESNEEAAAFAQSNMNANHISNAKVHCMPSEKMLELIMQEKTVIFDPPRSGLHPKIIAQTLQKKPIRIIYLSCNLETQARDAQLLNDAYQISDFSLFNFFPRTPHVEGLMVLDLK